MAIKPISAAEISERIKYENHWWAPPHRSLKFGDLPRRKYFELFFPFVTQRDPHRALILMGPRRIGKTVILFQSIQQLLNDGVPPQHIAYFDLQTPLYNGLSLEALLDLFINASGIGHHAQFFMFLDEVQYLSDWEVQLKNLVDRFPGGKFIASGSAAAALKLKSQESGAGRFTDFMLPPLTFYEYMSLINQSHLLSVEKTIASNTESVSLQWNAEDVAIINQHFIDYINFGGYPEAVFSPAIRQNPGQFIQRDIVDKVLMKDLPILYGIHDVKELNSLFTMLAYNTGQEVSLDQLCSKAGVAKNTIKKYIEYLESAFLVKVVHRVDHSAKRFKRANFFKVYLTNTCMRAALFAPLTADDEGIGSLVETAVFSQWFHWFDETLHYARWGAGSGEVDFVRLSKKSQKPTWAVEVKWSDACVNDLSELKSLLKFLELHPQCDATVTTRTTSLKRDVDGRNISFCPSSVYCYYTGWLVIDKKRDSKISVSLLPRTESKPTS